MAAVPFTHPLRTFANTRATRPVLDIRGLVVHRDGTLILGANGSGKTSLLSALTGYLTPSVG